MPALSLSLSLSLLNALRWHLRIGPEEEIDALSFRACEEVPARVLFGAAHKHIARFVAGAVRHTGIAAARGTRPAPEPALWASER